jgi:hypothetical protein
MLAADRLALHIVEKVFGRHQVVDKAAFSTSG